MKMGVIMAGYYRRCLHMNVRDYKQTWWVANKIEGLYPLFWGAAVQFPFNSGASCSKGTGINFRKPSKGRAFLKEPVLWAFITSGDPASLFPWRLRASGFWLMQSCRDTHTLGRTGDTR